MATLQKAWIIFGVPGWSDDEWNGDYILRSTCTIFLDNSTSFKAINEHRNTPVKKSKAINLYLPFTNEDMGKIVHDNVYEIEIILEAFKGQGGSMGDNCQFRLQTVLEFKDQVILATDGIDPPGNIHPGLGNRWSHIFRKPGFNDQIMKEPIG